MKTNKLRTAIPLVILLAAAVAYVAHIDVGTISSFGHAAVSMLCPLGALSTLVATKTVIPRVVVAVVIAVVLMIVLGRAFCGWACPVPVVSKLRDFFAPAKKRASGDDRARSAEAKPAGVSDVAPLTDEETAALKAGCGSCAKKRGNAIDSRHVILGGSLLTAAIFGFPVFCLVCPIGLTFATIFLLVNLFGAGDMTWGVLIAPVVLLVEVVFFRTWCSTFCPLAAFASLLTKAGRFFRPQIDDAVCLETTSGTSCGRCGEVCPEGIDPRHPALSSADACECTKCRACVENCPTGAIKLAVWASKPDGSLRLAGTTADASAKRAGDDER